MMNPHAAPAFRLLRRVWPTDRPGLSCGGAQSNRPVRGEQGQRRKRMSVMAKVHEFDSTSEACEAAQTDARIEDGDVLLVRSEHALAVMCRVGPVAVDGFT